MTGALDEEDGAEWMPPSAAELQALLTGYEVGEIIGRGGMGVVYKARQPSLDRFVAIKVLPMMEDALGVDFAERFRKEAQLLAKMSHPGIVHVYDFGELAGGLCYFVMEYIDGTDVARMVKANGRLSHEHAASITADVCAALHYAHEAGIVHRDIKPANILVTQQGQVKVVDFGLAKRHGTEEAESLTITGLALGTPEYAAPESLVTGMVVDHRADLYAVGVMLYNMLTGSIPRGVFKPVSEAAQAPQAFDRIIAKAMKADPEQRYQTAVAMKTDVQRAGSPQAVRRTLRWLALAACVALAIFGAWWLRELLVTGMPQAFEHSERDHSSAQWMFSKQGKVVLAGTSSGQKITSIAELPEPPYTIEEINFIGVHDANIVLSDAELHRELPKLKGLRRVIVRDSPRILRDITDKGIEAFTDVKAMHTLVLDGLPITDERLAFLSRFKGLERLSLVGCAIGGTGLRHAPPTLTGLTLNNCPLTDEGWAVIAKMPRLTSVMAMGAKSAFVRLDGRGAVDLAALRRHFSGAPQAKTEVLPQEVAVWVFQHSGTVELAGREEVYASLAALPDGPLDIRGIHFAPRAPPPPLTGEDVQKYLSAVPKLERLSFVQAPLLVAAIGGAGVEAILAHPGLTSVRLDHVLLSTEQSRRLFAKPGLKSAVVYRMEIRAEILAPAASRLETLELWESTVDEAGWQMICQMPELKIFGFIAPELSDERFLNLAAISKLEVCKVIQKAITQEAAQAFRVKRPDVQLRLASKVTVQRAR